MLERTPKIIYVEISNLCKGINSSVKPIFLDVENGHEFIPLDCFNNVSRKIRLCGGNIQYGWRVWEWPEIMLEAEFHAVWKDKYDNLHDISPVSDSDISKILFIPDYSRKYEGKQINNIRIPLQNDSLIIEFISINDRLFEAMNRSELAYTYGDIEMTDEMKALQLRKIQLLNTIVQKF